MSKHKLLRKIDFNNISIRWRIFSYLTAFVIATLFLIWIFQVVFLDSFYKTIKTAEIKEAAQIIGASINQDDFKTILWQESHDKEACALLATSAGAIVYSQEYRPECIIHELSSRQLAVLFFSSQNAGGSMLELVSENDFSREGLDSLNIGNYLGLPQYYILESDGAGRWYVSLFPREKSKSGEGERSLMYCQLVESDYGTLLLLLNTKITPIGATADILSVTLWYIIAILLLLSMLLAYIMHKKVSDPISDINKGAHELAAGNYDIVFSGSGYKEIAELNDTLNYAAKELSKTDKLQRELLANVSHDLRTPLSMIIGYGEVIRDIPGENTPENMQVIIDESKRLTALVNDMLDLSKLQSGCQLLEQEVFSFTGSVEDILKRYNKLVEQDGYSIDWCHDQEAFVCADEMKISQVIYNLINNAINYSGCSKSIKIIQSISQGRVKLEIIDNGEGIEPEQLKYIWDRYYKVDKTHRRAAIGTGLGLSIVKNVLQMHNAQYGVESTVGSGSTFWFSLPLYQQNQEEPKKYNN